MEFFISFSTNLTTQQNNFEKNNFLEKKVKNDIWSY